MLKAIQKDGDLGFLFGRRFWLFTGKHSCPFLSVLFGLLNPLFFGGPDSMRGVGNGIEDSL